VPVLLVLVLGISAFADSQGDKTKPEKMTKETRMNLIRAFEAETVFIRHPFPMGPTGLTVKDGEIQPGEEELQRLIAGYGPALKPGDRGRISNIEFKGDDRIVFEINGGPTKKKKWYQHIEVGMGGTMSPIDPSDPNANPRGTLAVLEFDKYVPELNPDQVKQLLSPVFDFHAKSAVEAYLDTLPAEVKDAIKDHQVLVGMNRDMVTYSLGRPPRKLREQSTDGVAYEEWIYGAPPQNVEFVRFVGDEVVRLETMAVDGKRTVSTEKAAAFDSPEYAKKQPPQPPGSAAPQPPAQPGASPSAQPGEAASAAGADSSASGAKPTLTRKKPPTLKRPGEEPTDTLPPMTTPDSTPRQPGEWGVPASGDPNQTQAPTQQPAK
jgi:hypothetical protein